MIIMMIFLNLQDPRFVSGVFFKNNFADVLNI